MEILGKISGNYDNQKGAVGIAFRIFLRFWLILIKIDIFVKSTTIDISYVLDEDPWTQQL